METVYPYCKDETTEWARRAREELKVHEGVRIVLGKWWATGSGEDLYRGEEPLACLRIGNCND